MGDKTEETIAKRLTPDGIGSNVDPETDAIVTGKDYKPPYSPDFIRQLEEDLGVKLDL